MKSDRNWRKNEMKLTYIKMKLTFIHKSDSSKQATLHAYQQSKWIGNKPWRDKIRNFRVIQDIVGKDPCATE